MITKAKLVYVCEVLVILGLTLFIASNITSLRPHRERVKQYISSVYMYGQQHVNIINRDQNLLVGTLNNTLPKVDEHSPAEPLVVVATPTPLPATIPPTLPPCSKTGEKLVGAMYIDQTVPDDTALKALSSEYGGTVEKGGWWTPTKCSPRRKVAIIIPYRNREAQLKMFLHHLHPVLQRQQLFYRIIVVEQLKDTTFNRAGLFNVGYAEALKIAPFDCFVFSDVDLLPENDHNYYGCPTSPRHMSVAVDKFNYRLPYHAIFGGVGSFLKEDFEKINGMSNLFWGWGGEDDDLYKRITKKGFKLTRPSMKVGRYTMIKVKHHRSHGANPNRMNLLRNSKGRMETDGLNDLKYRLEEVVEEPLVTFVKVHMDPKDYCKVLGKC